MTYTSRLFDAHRTVIESFIIDEAGLSEYKALKYAAKKSEAKIKYAMLEKVMEIIAMNVDVESVQAKLEQDKVNQARAVLGAAAKNHVPADEMIMDESFDELIDNAPVNSDTDKIPSYDELEADLVGTLWY